MCGIAGIISNKSLSASEKSSLSERVAETIYHRGPDGWSSRSYSGLTEGEVMFIHRRLKIIDLDDRANQPFEIENGEYSIVFNGEIYNYQELKAAYLSDIAFRTSSDTEVLIRLYQKFGKECLLMLNGIFAFGIFDRNKQEVFFARDHYGVKPFYYSTTGGNFAFSSEIKALFQMGVSARLNRKAVGEQIFYGYVAGRQTIYEGVNRLLPGHYLVIKMGAHTPSEEVHYFDLSGNHGTKNNRITDSEVKSTLETAIQRQMVSDVPVGFMCSGGIDSSAIASIASQFAGQKINTYCAKVPVRNFDESYYGRLVSEHIHSDHFEIETKPEDIAKLLPALIWAHDEPLKHPNSLPIYQINKKAKEHITVLLTGEGADEIFAGYYVFPLISFVSKLRKWVPAPLIRLVVKGLNAMGRQARVINAAISPTMEDLLVGMNASYPAKEYPDLIINSPINLDERKRFATESLAGAGQDPFQGLLYYYQHVHLVSLLDRQDKMSMINAIEGRVPFLDIDLVKTANSIERSRKIKGKATKVILRNVAKSYLPDEIFRRPKYPFALPTYIWARQSESFRKMLSDVKTGYLVREGYLNPTEYIKLLEKFLSGNQGLGDLIWNILNLELAAEIFVTGERQIDKSEFSVYHERAVSAL